MLYGPKAETLPPSFRRKPESSLLEKNWTPAFAGVTEWEGATGGEAQAFELLPPIVSPGTTEAYGQTFGSPPAEPGAYHFSVNS